MPWNSVSVEENAGGLAHPDASGASSRGCSSAPAVSISAIPRTGPASLSPLLAALFPPGVVAAELRADGDPSMLFPSEAMILARAGPKRIQQFAAGRHCARRCLTEFGFADRPLHMNRDRRPQWPAGLIGSISHTDGVCGAVVARRERFRAVGLDMEIIGRVTSQTCPYICTPEELDWLSGFGEPERGRYAAVIFSAKESFYKCQYGVTRQWLEFNDVTLNLHISDAASGYFFVQPQKQILLLDPWTTPWTGRFALHDNLVITGMALKAS